MSLHERDELAARIAAALEGDPDRVARRAYDLADALLRERALRERGADDADAHFMAITDPRVDAPPHDPSWELEPRWSLADRAALEEQLARLGPGLASVRPADEPDERTGT